MISRAYLKKFELEQDLLDTSNWEEVYLNDMPDKDKAAFLKKKEAVELFLNTEFPVAHIEKLTGISRSHIYRYVNRCLSFDKNDEIFGFKGLLLNTHVKKSISTQYYKSNVKNFSTLINNYPELEELLIQEYFNKGKSLVREKGQTFKNIHRKFLEMCRVLKIPSNEYPFTTKSCAYKSVIRFIKELENKNSRSTAKLISNDSLMLNTNVNNTINASTYITRPFERVEFDAHTIDAIFSIVTHTPKGDKIINTLNRIWILCVIDVASRAVIGYHLAFSNNNYSATDVLQCFKKALLPWEPKKLTIPGLKYNEGSGFSSRLIKEAKYAIWDEICFDNAKSHLSKEVVNNLLELNCSINYGPVATPIRRPIIERFFRTLENNGFHRLPSTTGSNPLDFRRDNPEEKSIVYEITINHIEQILDVILADYNNTPHTANYGFTPNEIIQSRINKGMYIRKLPKHLRDGSSLFPLTHKSKVNGNIKEGRNPYINYMYVRYSSAKLNSDYTIVGKVLTLLINSENIQTVKAFLPNGTFYDTLQAKGIWGEIPNSIDIRTQIMKHKNDRAFNYLKHEDPITAYQKYLEEKSITDKKARVKLQEIQQYKKEYNLEVQIEKKMEQVKKSELANQTLQQRIIEKNTKEKEDIEKNHSEIILNLLDSNINKTIDDVSVNEKEMNVNTTPSIESENLKTDPNPLLEERHKKAIEKYSKQRGRSITF